MSVIHQILTAIGNTRPYTCRCGFEGRVNRSSSYYTCPKCGRLYRLQRTPTAAIETPEDGLGEEHR